MTKEDAIHILMNPCDFGDHTYAEEKEAQQMAIDALRETATSAERAKLHDNGILAVTTSRYDKVRWIVVEDGKSAALFCSSHGAGTREDNNANRD